MIPEPQPAAQKRRVRVATAVRPVQTTTSTKPIEEELIRIAQKRIMDSQIARWNSGGDISAMAVKFHSPQEFDEIELHYGNYDNFLYQLAGQTGLTQERINASSDYACREILTELSETFDRTKSLFLGVLLLTNPQVVKNIRRHRHLRTIENAVAQLGMYYGWFYPPFTNGYIKRVSHLHTVKQRRVPNPDELPEIGLECITEQEFYDDSVFRPDYLPKGIRKLTPSERIYTPETVSRLPLLTPEEELELAREMKWCDIQIERKGQYPDAARGLQTQKKNAREQMIICNLRLVNDIAWKYYRRNPKHSLPVEDLFQEGIPGLIYAVDTYDYRRGVRFATYAYYWVRNHIVRAEQANTSLVIPGRHTQDDVEKLRRIREEYVTQHGEEPTVDYLAGAMGKTGKHIRFLEQFPIPVSSMDAKREDERDLLDRLFIVTAEEADQHITGMVYDLRQIVDWALVQLNPMQEALVRLRYGLGDGFFEHNIEELPPFYRQATGKKQSRETLRKQLVAGEKELKDRLQEVIQS